MSARGAIHPGEPAIVVEGLVKRFGNTLALDGLSFAGAQGKILAVLGPNGAGKTTAVRVLSTLITPDEGNARVHGVDVVADPYAVRRLIGLTGQYAAVDEILTGWENVEMVGRLFHIPRTEARARADELLARFDLTDAKNRPVKTYSGGMRRRLDIAASLVARPKVLFLDEPTTGLDPRSRIGMWSIISDLVKDGTTILLTTQYLEEADHLADHIVVIDHGRVIAEGTADSLKTSVGGQRLELHVMEPGDMSRAKVAVEKVVRADAECDYEAAKLRIPLPDGAGMLPEIIRELDAENVTIADVSIQRPTLDDVFLSLTGHHAIEDDSEETS